MDDATLGFFGAIFGSILGSYLTYRSTDKLNKEQQLNELKNIAKAMDINFESFSNSELVKYSKMYADQRSKRKPRLFISGEQLYVPLDPLYLPTDIYFTFKHDISNFDYNLSSDIYQFYTDLFKAEMNRRYIQNNNMNHNSGTQTICTVKQQDMEANIISCSNKISNIRLQLKKIYEE